MINFVSVGFLFQIFGQWTPGLTIALCGLGAIIAIIVLGQIGYIYKVRYRASVAPLTGWDYSSSEWAYYAGYCGLSKKPKGPAKVKITPLDIWIIDESKSIRLELDETLKCVTDWQFGGHILTLRVLWASSGAKGGWTFGQNNFYIPVPAGRERDALNVIEYFKKNRAKNNDKVATIMRHNDFSPLIWEANV